VSALTRQQLCAELAISESTVRRLELEGLPYTPARGGKRYDLVGVNEWLRARRPVPPATVAREVVEAMERLGNHVQAALRKGKPC
jgi:hypothetical protein